MAKYGVIYILNNKRHGDNVFKVGQTYDLDKRITELDRETSNVGNFKKVAIFPVSDTARAEKECHRALSRFRVHTRKEFFEGNQSEIISIVKNVVSNYKPKNEYPNLYSEAMQWTAKKVLVKWTSYVVAIVKQDGTLDPKMVKKFHALFDVAFADDADPAKKPVAKALRDLQMLMEDVRRRVK